MIILAATPIGNLGDASPRLREALETTSVIAAEDTRVATHLMRALGLENRPRLISMHDYNEAERVTELLAIATEQDLVVVSDAGMPTVSDPGYRLVAAARDAGLPVTVIPGPSAVLAALAVSGLPTDRFSFEGFPPRKAGGRLRFFAELADESRTQVFFESALRLAATLGSMMAAYGSDRRATVCRELTKKFEEVKHGTLAELVEWSAAGVRGEIVIVVEGRARSGPGGVGSAEPDEADWVSMVSAVTSLVNGGEKLKAACKQVAVRYGVAASDLYEAVLAKRAG